MKLAKRTWTYYDPSFAADKVCPLNPVWPWGGHRAFAYDLVRWMRPKRIAELGVHWGTSFFTFAQAIRDGRMAKHCELIGVDTFEGEEHAGRYGPEVFETVNKIIKDAFPRLSITLHRCYFREALEQVEDGSVDLLHIDGLHTYEAVKDDFESWLPKVAPEGIVLFHDVEPDKEYGSAEYWEELLESYPGFAFSHSWGLGVLFPKGESRLEALKKMGLDDKILLYQYKADAMRKAIEVRDLGNMATTRMEGLNKQSRLIEQLKAKQEESNKLIEQQRQRIKTMAEKSAQREKTIDQLHEQIRTMQLEHGQAVSTHRERLQAVESQLAVVQARWKELKERLTEHQQAVGTLRKERDALQADNAKLAKQTAELETTLAGLRAEKAALAEQLEHAKALQATLEGRLGEMVEHLSALARSQARAAEHQQAHAAALKRFEKVFDRVLGEHEARLETLNKKFARLDTDSELLSVRAEYLEELVAAHRQTLAQLTQQAGSQQADWLLGTE